MWAWATRRVWSRIPFPALRSAAKPSPVRSTARRQRQPRQLAADFDSEAIPPKTVSPLRPHARRYEEEEATRLLIGTPLAAAAVVYVIVVAVLLLCVILAALGSAWPGDLCLTAD